MNSDMAQGNWTEIKGKIRSKWGKFTDNDVESFKGHLDQIVGKVQQVYAYDKERAEKEFQEFKKAISQNSSSQNSGDKHSQSGSDSRQGSQSGQSAHGSQSEQHGSQKGSQSETRDRNNSQSTTETKERH